MQPILDILKRNWRSLLLGWAALATLLFVALPSSSSLPIYELWTDTIIQSGAYIILGALIYFLLSYANLSKLTLYQQVINYTVLIILTVGLWVGIGITTEILLFDKSHFEFFLEFIPSKIAIGLLLLIITAQYWKIRSIKKELETETENTNPMIPFNEIKTTMEHIDRISVKSGQKIHVIPIRDLYAIQSEGDYVRIFDEKNKYLKEQTMKYFEENLPNDIFVRVHRTAIVNIEKISHIELYEKQNQMLTLKNGLHIKSSIAGYKLLKLKLKL